MNIKNNLDNIQANILKSHGRNHTWCLFVRFSPGDEQKVQNAKAWIRDFANQLTTAKEQLEDSRLHRQNSSYDGGLVSCFFLSANGLKYLDWEKEFGEMDSSFKTGMKKKPNGITGTDRLNDKSYLEWEYDYARGFHAMILLADNSAKRLSDSLKEIMKSLEDKGEVLFMESGQTLRAGGLVREHFGYADGVSLVHLLDYNDNPIEEKCEDLVFDEHYGSYLVFRKYEQDVQAFNDKVRDLARRLNISEDYAGAQVIGRFKNGLPLAYADSGSQPANVNFSNYGDPDGCRCPFHAHNSKANPGLAVGVGEKRSIVRRGVTYGVRKSDLSDEPSGGVGLLFMCYQKSIKDQFEFIQSQWCNNSSYHSQPSGIDPLIGRGNGSYDKQHWNRQWDNKAGGESLDFQCDLIHPDREVVRLQGGEYLYAPSIHFLKKEYHVPNGKLSMPDVFKNPEEIRQEFFDTLLKASMRRAAFLKNMRQEEARRGYAAVPK